MGKTKTADRHLTADDMTPLLEPLAALQRLLDHFDNQGVIIGGIATSLLGKPRFTADLDAVILLGIQDLPGLIDAAKEQGIALRITDAEEFAQKNLVLQQHHQASGINTDISLSILPFDTEMVARSQNLKLGNLHLRLPTPEDLIILKAFAHRPQDLMDIEAVAANHPDLDKDRVRFWVEQFGATLELPDLWAQISQLL